jgi:hypothetical protein
MAMALSDAERARLDSMTDTQRIAAWVDIMDACDAFLLAGLREEVGEENLPEAYRKWYRETMADHDRMIFRLMSEIERRQQPRADQAKPVSEEPPA